MERRANLLHPIKMTDPEEFLRRANINNHTPSMQAYALMSIAAALIELIKILKEKK